MRTGGSPVTAATEEQVPPPASSTTDQTPATPSPPPEGAPEARLGRWTGHQLDPRDNSLNLIRLMLAFLVLYAHAYYIAGVQSPDGTFGPQLYGENLGIWAVYAFFALSGYLITSSRWSNSLGTYLVHRIARIFPAFLVCLLVMVTVVAPIGFLVAHGTLSGYLVTGPATPADFVVSNASLRMNAYLIAGTPSDIPFQPYPATWNGSLWSLYYEFQCYLVIGALGLLAWVRRSPLWIVAAWALSLLVHAGWYHGVATFVGGNVDFQLLFKLLPLFLGGAAVQLLRHKLPLHWIGAAVSALAIAAAIWLIDDGWGPQLTAPFMAYLLIWVGSVLPSPRLIHRHDISYGVYIYAFPVQQLLVLTGIHKAGLFVYDVAAVACTVPLAVASWLLIERPVMRRARRTGRGPTPAPTPIPATVPAPA